jgi:CubicO group peptidase (beta-lactamase class C family)
MGFGELGAIGQDRAFRLLLSARDRGRGLKLQDDGRESIYYANPPRLELGGTGLVSTAQDYLRFCRMMLNGGTLDGVQILSPKTVARFSLNHLPDGREIADMTLPGLFSGSTYAGSAFRSAAPSPSV